MHDVRMVLPAVAGWLVTVFALVADFRWVAVVAAVTAGPAALVAYRGGRGLMRLVLLTLVVTSTMALLAGARSAAIGSDPIAHLAEQGAVVTVAAVVTKDSRAVSPRLSVFEVSVRRVDVRGQSYRLRTPVAVFSRDAARFEVGQHLVAIGTLSVSQRPNTAATLSASRIAHRRSAAWWWSASTRVRAAVVESVSDSGAGPAALIPALVQGDEQRLTERMRDDFRRTGLTHLLAVSGTNLTIVLVSVLLIGRAVGVRGRGQWVLGLLSIICFVLLARPDPSVLRAAGMGVVALSALGYGRAGGVRALSCAVLALLLIDPWLARSIGFTLSVCATAGILLLAPKWSILLGRWMPRWCAIAVAVPTAAQLACTPVIAAFSGEISLVAVVANLLAGPAVAPATILGLVGGLVALVSAPASHILGLGAGLFARWIIAIAGHAAALPGASILWNHPLWLLVVVCILLIAAVSQIFSRPWLLAGLSMALIVGFVRPPDRGWPPPDWIMVACDVGQGDATILNAGNETAVVIDAGPEERTVDRCLKRLDVTSIPLLVFSHNHADHTDGWPGVVAGRRVGIEATGPTGAPRLTQVAHRQLQAGDVIEVGQIILTVLAPEPGYTVVGTDGSALNNASLVINAEIGGIRILLTGDIEPEGQSALLARLSTVRADVLKMPHHGSRNQDRDFIVGLGARFATISAGAGNNFGHPAPDALRLLRKSGITPLRTDLRGDIAIVSRGGKLWAESR